MNERDPLTAFETIRLVQDARGVARLTLARPEKHNAFNVTVIEELYRAATLLSAAPVGTTRALVLEAEGRSFCAGGDLTWMKAQAGRDRETRKIDASALAAMLRALDEAPFLTVAAVQGATFGGGVGLVAACDVAIAAEHARFSLSETRLGLVPAIIGPYVVRRLGEGGARRVFLHGRSFDAQEAQALGLVSQAVAADQLGAAVEVEIAAVLAAAPGAVADAKALCRRLARDPPKDTVGFTAGVLADRWDSAEARAGIAAFFARTRPPWAR